MRARIVIIVAVLCLPSIAFGQYDDRSDAVRRNASSALAGSSSLSGLGGATNRDYLSPFISALESLSDSKGQSMTFDWNFPLGVFGSSHRGKAQVILTKPPLGAAVAKELAQKPEELEALRRDLSLADDVVVTFSVSPKAAEKTLAAQAKFSAFRATMLQLAATNRLQAEGPSPASLGIAVGHGERLMRLFEDARTERDFERAMEFVAEGQALGSVQAPKYTFDATYHARRDVAGPDEFEVKARYEWGSDATETRIKDATEGCSNRYPASQDAKDKRQEDQIRAERIRADQINVCSFISAAALNLKLETHFRVVANLSFHSLSANNVVLSQAVTIPGKSSRSRVGSLSAGMDVFRPETIDHRGRLDLEITYDDVSKDPLRKDRLIGTVTYTQRISEKVQIPIKLVYANHADYLTNVDRKLNAHVGLSYKLPF